MNKKITAIKGKFTTPLFCMFVAGNLVGCEVDKEEPTFDVDSFKVSTNVGDGGNASIDSMLVTEGESVAITVTPNDGYELEGISGCEGRFVYLGAQIKF
ncbi:InlB B-repeat-containing protein [Colwellia piezophila]|uniref:InlB B-repeat-containing protein n=1 Tax=Colwellia piezophila TaxID=211668 RepID=UPI0003826F9D|nr:hypothetical protein [Colwellia piezophila]